MEISPVRLDASQMQPEGIEAGIAGATAGDKNAAGDLERLFATFVVKELRRTLPNGFFGKGAGADVYEGWFEEKLGSSLADSGAMDLAGSIKASIESKVRIAQSAAENGDNPR